MATDTYFKKILIREKNAFDEVGSLDKLSFRERERYYSIHPLKRNDYVMGRLALKKLLIDHYGKSFLSYEVLSNVNGSPYIATMPNMHCSISHSREYIAVMIGSRSMCGIDIEEKKNKSDTFAVYIMNKKEREILSTAFPAEYISTIAWCAKEAAFKSAQEGGGITQYSVISASGNEVVIERKALQFRIFIEISDNYIYAHGYQR
jgi:phosphopantetheinyl transferase